MNFIVIPDFSEGVVKRANKAASKRWKKDAASFKVGVRQPRPASHGHELTTKGAYYRWSAQKGHATAGGDPLTGKRKSSSDKGTDTAAYKAAHKAMAKTYIHAARTHRQKQTAQKAKHAGMAKKFKWGKKEGSADARMEARTPRRTRQVKLLQTARHGIQKANRMLPQKGSWTVPGGHQWHKTSKQMSKKIDVRVGQTNRAQRALDIYKKSGGKHKFNVQTGYTSHFNKDKKDKWGRPASPKSKFGKATIRKKAHESYQINMAVARADRAHKDRWKTHDVRKKSSKGGEHSAWNKKSFPKKKTEGARWKKELGIQRTSHAPHYRQKIGDYSFGKDTTATRLNVAGDYRRRGHKGVARTEIKNARKARKYKQKVGAGAGSRHRYVKGVGGLMKHRMGRKKESFLVVPDFAEAIGKAKRSKAGEELRGMYKKASRQHRTKDYSGREKTTSKLLKKAYPQYPGKGGPGKAGRYRAAGLQAVRSAGDLRKAAAKGSATTPKGTPFAKSYTLTKGRTALRKAKGDKATRSKIHKGMAQTMIQHSRLMRQAQPKGESFVIVPAFGEAHNRRGRLAGVLRAARKGAKLATSYGSQARFHRDMAGKGGSPSTASGAEHWRGKSVDYAKKAMKVYSKKRGAGGAGHVGFKSKPRGTDPITKRAREPKLSVIRSRLVGRHGAKSPKKKVGKN